MLRFCDRMDDLTLFKNRMTEKAETSYRKGIWCYSHFLTVAEQGELKKLRLPVGVSLYGGYENAERRIAVFGDENNLGYEASPPVVFLRISPVAEKFADELTHRDFLGSLMGLGIKRATLGDILLDGNNAYLICLESIADYIQTQLSTVRRTSVSCEMTDCLPENALPKLTPEEVLTSSERLDALIAAVWHLSRNAAQGLITGEKVFCDSVLITSASFMPKPGSVISVRGCGRFFYDGVLRSTKKGRNVIAVRKY